MAEIGSFGVLATGNSTINLANGSFTPSIINFQVGPRNSTVEGHAALSVGSTDGTNQFCISTYAGSSTEQTVANTTHCMYHYRSVSGTMTLVLSFSIVSISAGQFVINVDTKHSGSNYTVYFEAI